MQKLDKTLITSIIIINLSIGRVKETWGTEQGMGKVSCEVYFFIPFLESIIICELSHTRDNFGSFLG